MMFNSAEFIANPYPTYDRLRSRGPIHWINNSFGGAWLLPGYSDVVNGLIDSRLSARRSHIVTDRLPPDMQDEVIEFGQILSMWLVNTDPPLHRHLRKFLQQNFTSEVLQAMHPRIQKITDTLLDRVCASAQMDFMRDFAYPLPALVIAELLGVDPGDHTRFIQWSDDIATFLGRRPTLESARRAQHSLMALTDYFRVQLHQRQKNVGGLVSLLLRAKEQEEFLTQEQALAQCSLLLVAGHETTRNLLGNGLLALLQHPNQLEMLKMEPSLIPLALPELLRYESPIQFVARIAGEDFSLHNQQIKQGQIVYFLIGAANRDPARFSDPDILDITRQDRAHLAFGWGPHFCLGAALANLEAEIAFQALFERMPKLRLVDNVPDWNPKVSLRTLRTLPLAF